MQMVSGLVFSRYLSRPSCTNGVPANLMLGVALRSTSILDNINGTCGTTPTPPILTTLKLRVFAPSRLYHCFGGGGDGVYSFFFILSKDKTKGTSGPPLPPFQWSQNGEFLLVRTFTIVLVRGGGFVSFCSVKIAILDKVNGISGPPLPPFHWCQNGECLLLRAFIMASGKIRLLFFFMLSKIVASHPGGSRKISRRYRNRDKLWPDGPFGLYRLYELLLLHRNPNI